MLPTQTTGPTKRPQDSAFKQQQLPAWQPTMNPPFTVGFMATVSVVFISLGIAIIVASDGIFEMIVGYDERQSCPFAARRPELGYACSPLNITFSVPRTLRAPVYMYYQLGNFYQNQRRYAKSVIASQLAGEQPDPASMTDCKPFQFIGQYTQLQGNTTVALAPSGPFVDITNVVYNPCGLVAWSMFNDSFILSKLPSSAAENKTLICNGENFDSFGNVLNPTTPMSCQKKGIAWSSDPGVRFSDPRPSSALQATMMLTNNGWPETPANATPYSIFMRRGWYMNEEGHGIPDTVDEDFMVWARPASLSQFRKLYRIITVDLEPGTYEVLVKQRSDYSHVEKTFVLATTSWVGGKAYFLGGLCAGVGCLTFVLAIGFLVKHVLSDKRLHT